ncbi:MAG: lytic murein transglycosylase [Alphaproteobacteria bacterium]|nr:lytic murein transglycosylase [Alphaproteobacteria bacterium]
MKKLLSLGIFIGLLTPATALAEKSFESWLVDFKKEAIAKGVSEQTLNQSFQGVKPIPRIIELDRKQPEGTMTFDQYRKRVINNDRIQQGRRLYQKHRALLDKTAQKYGVPAPYIVALWGIETSYGNNTGGFGVINALATLAHDGRRSSFFTRELINALKILDAGHISHSNMKGSWAGAMGQNQFMPSSFHAFAVDGNGDGKRDIWTSLPDVFASTANYLSTSGWKEDQRWGREVKLPKKFKKSDADLKITKPLSEWKSVGVKMPDGKPIPVVEGMKASVVTPDGINGPAYLVYDNYRVIMKWNKSTYFATSVGLLADSIAQ